MRHSEAVWGFLLWESIYQPMLSVKRRQGEGELQKKQSRITGILGERAVPPAWQQCHGEKKRQNTGEYRVPAELSREGQVGGKALKLEG